MNDLPGLQEQVTPFLPIEIVRRYSETLGAFDAGRGCPFQCSFCTIINVQGRKSRWRDADDVEQLVRANLAQGVFRFFITDDNFARNRNWEAIFDRLIAMRETEGLTLNFLIQVDTLCHRIPNFIEKAARAGCSRVFIGLENINPDNLLAGQEKAEPGARIPPAVSRMAQAQGHHLCRLHPRLSRTTRRSGSPATSRTVQRELPVDLLEFFILTPLPGSADHKELYTDRGLDGPRHEQIRSGARHRAPPGDDRRGVAGLYRKAFDLYYSPEHIEPILRRAKASGIKPVRLVNHVLQFYFTFRQENVHPLQGGFFRRKIRRQRRSGLPRENPLFFYPRRVWEVVDTHVRLVAFYLFLHRIRRRVERDPAHCLDPALTPIADDPPTLARGRKALAGAAA